MTSLRKISELGQVWTPSDIALQMAQECFLLNPKIKSVLDPACGPATFSYALKSAGATNVKLVCYDVDVRMKSVTLNANKELGFSGSFRLKDYLSDTSLQGRFDLVIMNPPYIRQESIASDTKDAYHEYLSSKLGSTLDRRTNLFVLFMLKGIVDLAPNGLLSVIVYDAISQTGYGKKALKLLDKHAELISCRHARTPFDEVLVDAQVMVYRKRDEPLEVAECDESNNDGLVELNDLLVVRRGTALPRRAVFLAKESEPHFKSAKPFFVKQSKLSSLVIKHDKYAYINQKTIPLESQVIRWLKDRAAVLNSSLSKFEIQPVTGPIVFNYYIRNAARHLWNINDVAVSDNFYVSVTRESFPAEVAWLLLNSETYLSKILAAARNQGSGLSKLQLYEYKAVRVPDWRLLSKKQIRVLMKAALSLINCDSNYESVRLVASKLAGEFFNG